MEASISHSRIWRADLHGFDAAVWALSRQDLISVVAQVGSSVSTFGCSWSVWTLWSHIQKFSSGLVAFTRADCVKGAILWCRLRACHVHLTQREGEHRHCSRLSCKVGCFATGLVGRVASGVASVVWATEGASIVCLRVLW